MNKIKINIAILGCVIWTSNHARVLSEIGCVNLVGIANIDSIIAKNIKKNTKKNHIQIIQK